MRLCLGTANYNKHYGINKFKIKKDSIKKILKFSEKKNFKYLDTAFNYNNYQNLPKNKYFEIITKVNKLRDFNINKIETEIINQINPVYKKSRQLYAILLHDCDDMRSKKSKEIFQSLLNLKKKKITKKIGISCYHEKDLNILKLYDFDIVQFPLNIFDQRLLKKKNLKKIKDKEIHIRSIFLQGLLIDENFKKIRYFSKWKSKFQKLEKYLKNKKTTSLEACIFFVKKFKFVKMAVVGVNNLNQLKLLSSIMTKKNK